MIINQNAINIHQRNENDNINSNEKEKKKLPGWKRTIPTNSLRVVILTVIWHKTHSTCIALRIRTTASISANISSLTQIRQ